LVLAKEPHLPLSRGVIRFQRLILVSNPFEVKGLKVKV